MKTFGAVKGSNPVVEFKVGILEKAMPAESAVVFGDMWKVDGFYTKKTLELGCKRAVLFDSLETEKWLKTRLQFQQIEFFKGDFSNTLFMKSIQEKFDIGVAFDILLHQALLLNTLHLMLEKIEKRFASFNPCSGNNNIPIALFTYQEIPTNYIPWERSMASTRCSNSQVNQSHWIWGMTSTFLHAVLLEKVLNLFIRKSCRRSPTSIGFGVAISTRRNETIHHIGQPPR